MDRLSHRKDGLTSGGKGLNTVHAYVCSLYSVLIDKMNLIRSYRALFPTLASYGVIGYTSTGYMYSRSRF